MLIKNARIENNEELTDIRIKDGVFEQIGKLEAMPEEEVLDLNGKLLLPPFIESHVHLDTCLTAGDPAWNMSGTLFEGIELWSRRKEKQSGVYSSRPGDRSRFGFRCVSALNPFGQFA